MVLGQPDTDGAELFLEKGQKAISRGSRRFELLRAAVLPSGRARQMNWRNIAGWLVHCADPLGPRGTPPPGVLAVAEVRELVAQAEAHGVLAAVSRNFRALAREDELRAVKLDVVGRVRVAGGHSLMLRRHAEALGEAGAKLPLAIVKGAAFARSLYPSPALRPFTGVDLLVDPGALFRVSELLETQGFKHARRAEPDREGQRWVHGDNEALQVDVWTNLVRWPSLGATLSLTYEDLGGIAETPAAQLIVASLDGALGGQFEMLRQVADVCQAARALSGTDEEERFSRLVEQSGARLAARVGLTLAGGLFAEPRCHEIARQLGVTRHAFLASRLISRSAVVSTATPARSRHSWRRKVFRELLKRGAPLARRREIQAEKVCLVFLFNHAYPANIEKLRGIYGNRFSKMLFLLPNTHVAGDPACFTGYRGSFSHQGLIADARAFLMAQDADVFVFAGDDALLNPKVNETNVVEVLGLGENDGFVATLDFLAGQRRCDKDDTGPRPEPAPEWVWTRRVASRLVSSDRLFGSGAEGFSRELPDLDTAMAKFERYGTPSLDLVFPTEPAPGLPLAHKLPFPMAFGFSDVFAIRRERLERFTHYLGIFAALDLFVEVAVPTALILATESIVTAAEIERPFYWGYELGTPLGSVRDLETWYPSKQLFVHPVKLSRVIS